MASKIKFQLINTVSHKKSKTSSNNWCQLDIWYSQNLMTERTMPSIEMKIISIASLLATYIKKIKKNGCTFNGGGGIFSHESVSITVKYWSLSWQGFWVHKYYGKVLEESTLEQPSLLW